MMPESCYWLVLSEIFINESCILHPMEYGDLLLMKLMKLVSKQIKVLIEPYHDAVKILIMAGLFVGVALIAFLLYLWLWLWVLPILMGLAIFFEILNWLFMFESNDLLRGPLSPKK